MKTESPEIFRFGTFEVDVRSGELRKQGKRIKLQEQPFHVLTLLLHQPGDVVTREELRTRIWSADTFVDFDNSLNAAVNKLREALGDSADSPRFIETVPRRGYRFIAPISSKDRIEKLPPEPVPRRRGRIAVAVAVVLVIVMASAAAFYLRSKKPRLTGKDTIVLADFANTTGDSVFDDALKQGLRVQLEQSPFLNILSDEKVSEELQLMGRTKDERLTKDLARDLCQRIGSKAVLAGSIASIGTHYAIGLNAWNCLTGDGLANEQVEVDSREEVIKALGESATRMRKKLGESLATIQKYDAPLEQVTTRSIEALKAYSLGVRARHTQGAPASIPFFKRAVELDPQFAMAYGRLAGGYDMAGEVDLAKSNLRKAYELRGRVSERERLYLESHYYHSFTVELDKAAQTYELWKQIYPGDSVPFDNLQNVYAYQGKQEEALAEGLEALRLNPNNVAHYEDVVLSCLLLSRLNEAQAALSEANKRQLHSHMMLWLQYFLAVSENDLDEMQRLVAESERRQTAPHLEGEQGTWEASLGHLRKARGLWRQAANGYEKTGPAEFATFIEDTEGLADAYFGNAQKARADVAHAQKLTVNRFSEPVSALALAMAGDVQGARKLRADIQGKWPLDSGILHYWLPTIQAAEALHAENAKEAIELLRVMGSYEMSIEGNLDPVYIRGLAYLKLGNGEAAAREFQRIIDHPGLVIYRPLGTLARLGLARAYVIQSDTPKARKAYEDFLTLWKDADADIPILKEAKAEYGKLQ